MSAPILLALISCSLWSSTVQYDVLSNDTKGCTYNGPIESRLYQYKYVCGSQAEGETLLFSRRIQRTGRWVGYIQDVAGYPWTNEYSHFNITRYEVAYFISSITNFVAGGIGQSQIAFQISSHEGTGLDVEVKIWGVYERLCPKKYCEQCSL